jgi:hypothetical protein
VGIFLDLLDLLRPICGRGSGERPEIIATKEGVKHVFVKLKREKK